MVRDREQLNARTRIVVTDRVNGIVHGVRVYLVGVSDEEMSSEVNDELIVVMRRLAQSPRHGGPDHGARHVNDMAFQGALAEYLTAWRRVEQPTARGEWNVEVPIRIFRMWESEERDPVQANTITHIEIDEGRSPPPPPGVIDTAHERVDEVLDELERECGGEEPMSRLIRRWRNGHVSAAQAKYLDEATARRYAHMPETTPGTAETHALDIRNTFNRRLTTETSVELRVESVRQIVPNGINQANRFIADQIRILNSGGQIRPIFIPARIHDLKRFVRSKRDTLGSVYRELEVDRGPCEWQWVNYYDLFDD